MHFGAFWGREEGLGSLQLSDAHRFIVRGPYLTQVRNLLLVQPLSESRIGVRVKTVMSSQLRVEFTAASTGLTLLARGANTL